MSETAEEELPRNLQMAKELGIPILTEAEKQALFDREDHGVTTAVGGVGYFESFEEWQGRGGKGTGGYMDNFYQRFSDGGTGDAFRALQCYQRFEVLYPELTQELVGASNDYVRGVLASSKSMDWSRPKGPDNPSIPKPQYDEELDKKFFDAYNKLAELIDVHDVGIDGGFDIPEGMVNPIILVG